MRTILWALAAVLAPLHAAYAAESTAGTAAALCELHVWPSGPLRSTYYGWVHGGIVDGSVQGRPGYPKLPDQPLTTARQVEILNSQDLPAILGLPGFRTVLHDQPLESRVLRGTVGRILANSPPCYAELAIDDVFFQADVFSGAYLKTLARFRRFDAGDTPTRTFGTIATEKLTQFPPVKSDADPADAVAELSAAFGKSLTDFGRMLAAPPKRKH